MVSVATTSRLSPSVYAAPKRSPNTSIVTEAANGGACRLARRKNTTRVLPYWISIRVIAVAPGGRARWRKTRRARPSAPPRGCRRGGRVALLAPRVERQRGGVRADARVRVEDGDLFGLGHGRERSARFRDDRARCVLVGM